MKIQNTPKDTDTDSRFREIEVNESNHLRQYKKMKKIVSNFQFYLTYQLTA